MIDRASSNNAPQPDAGSAPARQQLLDLRQQLLRLHKTLLDSERAAYEQFHGKVSNFQMLRLVIDDEWFSWLHPFSRLIVQMDDALQAEEPVTAAEVDRFFQQTGALLPQVAMAPEVEKQYQAALQRDVNVVIAHSKMLQFLEQHMPQTE